MSGGLQTRFSRGLSARGAKTDGKTAGAEAPTDGKKGKKPRRRRLLRIIGLLFLAGALAGGWFFFLKPSGPSQPKEVVHTAGTVVTLDPITINLAGGHFLKLGMALQADAKAGEEVTGAKALDLAIEVFSGKTLTELSTKDGREKAKEKLVGAVTEAYENEVYDIYFTEFVYQ
jgi:flagellar FliL protein